MESPIVSPSFPRAKSDAHQIKQISEHSGYDGRPCIVIAVPQYGNLGDLITQSVGEVKHLNVEHESVYDQLRENVPGNGRLKKLEPALCVLEIT